MRLAVLAAFALLAASAAALQKPERHYGCPPGKNVCIYPIDDASLTCGSIFDFQVALHVPANDTVKDPISQEWTISIKLPNGDVMTPNDLFGKEPEYRNWKLKAFEDAADETPEGFDSYAAKWVNVKIPREVGKGKITVTVEARGVTTVVHYDVRTPTKRRAKNVILFVGDGMAMNMISAARLVSRGISHGKYKDFLYMEKMPHFAMQNPAGVDSIITDSANSASSMNTGHKSSVNALGVYADSGDDNFAHPKQETIAEHIKRNFGMSVGVVTTAEVQDATPAAVWAHTRRRAEKATIISQAINGCKSCVTTVKPDVILGGGGKYFLPSRSVDGSNMYQNFSDAGYTVAHDRAGMKAAAADPATSKLLGIFHAGNMEVWLDRNVYTDNMNKSSNAPKGDDVPPTDQPNLNEMVKSAIDVLSKNDNGFYLMVEAASIDKSAHPLDVPRTISDLIELDNTIGETLKWAKDHGDESLVIVTADHAHGFEVFGTVDTKIWDNALKASEDSPVTDYDNYCGNVTDATGKVFPMEQENDVTNGTGFYRRANQARRLAIGIYSGAGYPDYTDEDGDHFPDTWDVRTVLAAGMNNFPDHTEDYKVTSSIRRPALRTADRTYLNNPADNPNGIFISGNLPPGGSTGVHTLADVGIYAHGPGADLFRGVMDNTEIYHIIAAALGFGYDGEQESATPEDGTFVKCINDNDACHCISTAGEHKCLCSPGSHGLYVKEGTKLCEKECTV